MSLNQHSNPKAQSRTYRCWADMKKRCYNKNRKDYRFYGGKGITVEASWHLFENFLKDMGECPPGFSIERKNPALNYNKENCCYIPKDEQYFTKRPIPVGISGERGLLQVGKYWKVRANRGEGRVFLGSFLSKEAAIAARNKYLGVNL